MLAAAEKEPSKFFSFKTEVHFGRCRGHQPGMMAPMHMVPVPPGGQMMQGMPAMMPGQHDGKKSCIDDSLNENAFFHENCSFSLWKMDGQHDFSLKFFQRDFVEAC